MASKHSGGRQKAFIDMKVKLVEDVDLKFQAEDPVGRAPEGWQDTDQHVTLFFQPWEIVNPALFP